MMRRICLLDSFAVAGYVGPPSEDGSADCSSLRMVNFGLDIWSLCL